MRSLLHLIFASLLLSGCASFHSVPLMRTADHGIHREWRGKHHAGIPVKLKIPSHVGVTIYEQQVLIQQGSSANLVSFEPPQYEIETRTIYTDKMFLVDFKRPAAGRLTLGQQNSQASGVEFDDDQYFTKIQAEYEEKTLQDITAGLGKIGQAVKGSPPVANAKTASAGLISETQTITFPKSALAYQQFDLSEPDWELRLNDFTTAYLAKCGGCQFASSAACPGSLGLPCPTEASSKPKEEVIPQLELAPNP